ncbi:MarR family winged helix-turn-helix transcriptional regulator [Thermodesulfobacteriota bacterium]
MVDRKYKNDLNTDEKVLMAIVRTAELFKKNSSAIFKKYGLTFSQYNILRVLDSSENGQNSISNIRQIMLFSGARITGLAQRLEKNGFILRKSVPDDERKKVLQITTKGSQALKNIFDDKENLIKGYLINLSDEEKNLVLRTLKRVLATSRS